MAGTRIPMQGEISWVNLDPTVGKAIKKRRPCLVVCPDDMNAHLGTVIAAPITGTLRAWPTRVSITSQRQIGAIALDQIRTIDGSRLIRRMTRIDPEPALVVLREMFAA